jgi:hypothetical protein
MKPTLDLKHVYEQLKDKYDLTLTTGLAVDAGFGEDLPVLTGKSGADTFYLYDNGANIILDYNTEAGISDNHWHPEDEEDAARLVMEFMEGRLR